MFCSPCTSGDVSWDSCARGEVAAAGCPSCPGRVRQRWRCRLRTHPAGGKGKIAASAKLCVGRTDETRLGCRCAGMSERFRPGGRDSFPGSFAQNPGDRKPRTGRLQPLKGCAGEVGRTPPGACTVLTPGQAGAPRALWAGVVAAEGLLVSSLAKPIQHCPELFLMVAELCAAMSQLCNNLAERSIFERECQCAFRRNVSRVYEGATARAWW